MPVPSLPAPLRPPRRAAGARSQRPPEPRAVDAECGRGAAGGGAQAFGFGRVLGDAFARAAASAASARANASPAASHVPRSAARAAVAVSLPAATAASRSATRSRNSSSDAASSVVRIDAASASGHFFSSSAG